MAFIDLRLISLPRRSAPFGMALVAPSPLRGVIRVGSVYRVEARKGFVSYIAFRTAIDSRELAKVSGPLVAVDATHPTGR
jgi:hypothetical protein